MTFELQATLLHFVLGYEEPASSVFITRPSRIPTSDMVPGKILAAFNAGFKAQYGYFGVMLDGLTLFPSCDGFRTVAMYTDGKVALGAWGRYLFLAPDGRLAPERPPDHSGGKGPGDHRYLTINSRDFFHVTIR